MKNMSWFVGIGVIALAMLRFVFPRKSKSTAHKAMNWSRHWMNPMSSVVMRTGRRMVKGMMR